MTEKTRKILFRAGAVIILLAIAAVMMIIGRGHTVYIDNKTLEYNGETYPAMNKVTVYVGGEKIAKLAKRERGMSTCIGQKFKMTLEIVKEKGDEPETREVVIALPYDIDGIVISLPGFLEGLPEEAWMSEFVSLATEVNTGTGEDEEIPSSDEFALGDF